MNLKDLIKDYKITIKSDHSGQPEIIAQGDDKVMRVKFTVDELECLQDSLTDLSHAILLFNKARK